MGLRLGYGNSEDMDLGMACRVISSALEYDTDFGNAFCASVAYGIQEAGLVNDGMAWEELLGRARIVVRRLLGDDG